MIDLRAVRRYSQALFGLSEQAGNLDSIDDQMLAVRQVVERHPEIGHLVSNSTISLPEKEDFIVKVFSKNILPLIINFLRVLIRKNRFAELVAIQKDFHSLYEKKRRIEEVIVVSAIELSKENTSKLESVLEKKFKSDINLIVKVDPQMIGGLILRFGGHEINASFRSRLNQLHQSLTA